MDEIAQIHLFQYFLEIVIGYVLGSHICAMMWVDDLVSQGAKAQIRPLWNIKDFMRFLDTSAYD
jgi:hypothetical protein